MRRETDKDTQLILHTLGDNVIHHPIDNAIILNNGQIYRMNNRIVEIIYSITALILFYAISGFN